MTREKSVLQYCVGGMLGVTMIGYFLAMPLMIACGLVSSIVIGIALIARESE